MVGELRDKPEESAEQTPEQFRDAARTPAEDLLKHRRFTAKLICRTVVDVGRSHAIPAAPILKWCLGRLQIMDAEISRRHLGLSSTPP